MLHADREISLPGRVLDPKESAAPLFDRQGLLEQPAIDVMGELDQKLPDSALDAGDTAGELPVALTLVTQAALVQAASDHWQRVAPVYINIHLCNGTNAIRDCQRRAPRRDNPRSS
jgi:hypothetical protein